MLDYYEYTRDPSYNAVVIQALLAPTNTGPEFNYMPPQHADEEGNDDLFFWGSAVLSAAERNFPQPNEAIPSWLDLSVNVFNQLVSRWDTKYCGGGLFWQIYASNPNGMNYKNTVSNGGFFQLAARLARATGNDTYLDWAEKIWDWNAGLGFIDSESYRVYDGAGIQSNCKDLNTKSYTYTTGIFLYGAAIMAEQTGDDKWSERAEKLLDEAGNFFFTGPDKNIMYETECEQESQCNYDQITFKGYLSRFMWQTTKILPSLKEKVNNLLIPSAQAAVLTCTGGDSGHLCGLRWDTEKFDYATLGGQMSVLEVVQGLLIDNYPAPLKASDIKTVRDANFKPIDTYADDPPKTTTKRAPAPSTQQQSGPKPSKKSGAGSIADLAGDKMTLFAVAIGTVLAAWSMA